MKISAAIFFSLIISIASQAQSDSLKFLRINPAQKIQQTRIELDSAINKIYSTDKVEFIEAKVIFNPSKSTFHIGYYFKRGQLYRIIVHEDSSVKDLWRTFDFEIKSGEVVSEKSRLGWTGALTGIAWDANEDFSRYFSKINLNDLKDYSLRLFERIRMK